jgi:hypothetical protein
MGCIDVGNTMCRGKSISSKTEGTCLRFHPFGFFVWNIYAGSVDVPDKEMTHLASVAAVPH